LVSDDASLPTLTLDVFFFGQRLIVIACLVELVRHNSVPSRIFHLKTLVLLGRGVSKSDISRSKGKGEYESYGVSYAKGRGVKGLGEDDEWVVLVQTFDTAYMLVDIF